MNQCRDDKGHEENDDLPSREHEIGHGRFETEYPDHRTIPLVAGMGGTHGMTLHTFRSDADGHLERIDHLALLVCGHLREQGQDDAAVLGLFALLQLGAGAWRAVAVAVQSGGTGPRVGRVGALTVGAHDPAAGGDAGVEHALHRALLVDGLRQAHAVALPVAPGPRRARAAGRDRGWARVATGSGRPARGACRRSPAGA